MTSRHVTPRCIAACDQQPLFPTEPPLSAKLPKELGMWLASRIGVALYSALKERAGNTLGILMYHRVIEPVPGLPAPLYNVPPRRLREQLIGLVHRGFEFWPLSKALGYHTSGMPIPPKTVSVTFDDGYATLYTKAFPLLRELGIPATVFVSTAYLDRKEPFPFDNWGVAHYGRAPAETYRPLTTEGCGELLASGLIEIGAHTHTHADHRGNPEAFRNDVQASVDIVRARFGVERISFAFPYGGRDTGFAGHDLAEAARQTGVTCGLTTEAELVEPESDPFQWGRFDVFPWDSSATLAAKLSGWYSWAPRLNKRCIRCVKQLVGRRVASLPFRNSHSDSYLLRNSHR